MSDRSGDHAIVLGGSIAGLLAARVLADAYDQVTVVDYGQHRLVGREQETVQVYGLVSLKEGDPTLYHQVQAELQAHLKTPFPGETH